MKLSLAVFYFLSAAIACSVHSSNGLSTKTSIEVSSQDIQFEINENYTFQVYLSNSINETLGIFFNYSEGNNLDPLPNDYFIENGTLGNLAYVLSSHQAGLATVFVNATPPIADIQNAFIRVGVYKVYNWVIISSVIGWLYFVAWSISFYPQVIDNYRRKSVVGLNFDFLGLNLTGFIAYSVYNIGFRFVTEIQHEYHSVHPTGVIPVEVNDVVFAVHALFATIVTIGQCFIYERGDQVIAKSTVAVLALVWSTAAVFLLITSLNLNKTIPWLTFIYFFSYVKLGVTLTKYVPQVYYNYKRKSTVGWSIGTVLLDFVGGLFSIAQMFINAYNFNEWHSIMSNFTKFGLGVISVAFDVIFFVQHYFLYSVGINRSEKKESTQYRESFPTEEISSITVSNKPFISYGTLSEAEKDV